MFTDTDLLISQDIRTKQTVPKIEVANFQSIPPETKLDHLH